MNITYVVFIFLSEYLRNVNLPLTQEVDSDHKTTTNQTRAPNVISNIQNYEQNETNTESELVSNITTPANITTTSATETNQTISAHQNSPSSPNTTRSTKNKENGTSGIVVLRTSLSLIGFGLIVLIGVYFYFWRPLGCAGVYKELPRDEERPADIDDDLENGDDDQAPEKEHPNEGNESFNENGKQKHHILQLHMNGHIIAA